jgi:hypothetical protein
MSETDDIHLIAESARRLGMTIDEAGMATWLAAMNDSSDGAEVVVDLASGTFGHRVSMLDFSPKELDRFRKIGEVVQLPDIEGVAEGALALSGSAAQSKIQSFPGDADFFQRVNIMAATREEACRIMADLMRDKVLSTIRGDTFQFLEAKLGTFPFDCHSHGWDVHKGSPISWNIDEIRAGELIAELPDGTSKTLLWHDVALDPGWCKLDWVVSDPIRRQLSNASNVIDVTWEAPDGAIVPLDGYLDAYFQEVYLDSDEVPVFQKVAKFVTDDALDDYVDRIEREIHKYLTKHLNYGKAAKRMYNVFRLTGRHLDAAYVRELFDEPTTILYQVWSLILTLENATKPGSSIPIPEVQAQADKLILDVVQALDGDAEAEIVKALLELRQTLEGQNTGEERTADVEAAQALVVNQINTFFHDRLVDRPTIKEYIDQMQAPTPA